MSRPSLNRLAWAQHVQLAEVPSGPDGVTQLQIQPPALPKTSRETIQRLATAANAQAGLRDRFPSWLAYTGESFQSEIYLSPRDFERAEASLAELSMADLQAYKRALVAGHSRRWEIERHPALKDPSEGARKPEQIRRILTILSGEVFADARDGRAELSRLSRSVDALLSRPSGELALREVASLGLGLDHLEDFAATLRTRLADDPAALRRLDALQVKLTQLGEALRPVQAQVEADFAQLRAQLADGALDLSVLASVADPDTFLEFLLGVHAPPKVDGWRGTDRLGYQATPYHTIRQILDRVELGPDDTFADLGCGMGKVLQTVALTSGCRAFGVEYDPKMAEAANAALSETGLGDRVAVRAGDAAEADLDGCNVFYMFNPFVGETLKQVMARIEQVAKDRPVTVCTMGPVRLDAAWLQVDGERGRGMYDVTVYRSKAPEPT